MAEEKSLTPEKQLLRLIEEPKTQGHLHSVAIKHFGLSLFSSSVIRARISFLKDRLKNDFKNGRLYRLNVKTLNIILGLWVFILASYFITNFLISVTHLKKTLNLDLKTAKNAQQIDSQAVSSLKVVSHYLEKVRARDIFKMGSKKTQTDDAGVKAPSSKIMEATANLKLVGISWSDDPDAMIEDTKLLRTFFMKRGQMIGEVRVQAIFKDKVVLSYAGEEVELR